MLDLEAIKARIRAQAWDDDDSHVASDFAALLAEVERLRAAARPVGLVPAPASPEPLTDDPNGDYIRISMLKGGTIWSGSENVDVLYAPWRDFSDFLVRHMEDCEDATVRLEHVKMTPEEFQAICDGVHDAPDYPPPTEAALKAAAEFTAAPATGGETLKGGVAAIFGKWPGDETDEEINAALAKREPVMLLAEDAWKRVYALCESLGMKPTSAVQKQDDVLAFIRSLAERASLADVREQLIASLRAELAQSKADHAELEADLGVARNAESRLRVIALECVDACGGSAVPTISLDFLAHLPEEIRLIRSNLAAAQEQVKMWRPLTPEEAEEAFRTAEAVPLSDEELERIINAALDPASDIPNSERAQLAVDNQRLRERIKELEGERDRLRAEVERLKKDVAKAETLLKFSEIARKMRYPNPLNIGFGEGRFVVGVSSNLESPGHCVYIQDTGVPHEIGSDAPIPPDADSHIPVAGEVYLNFPNVGSAEVMRDATDDCVAKFDPSKALKSRLADAEATMTDYLRYQRGENLILDEITARMRTLTETSK